jgi:uncharacterized protein YjbI with pentapeptide repeats
MNEESQRPLTADSTVWKAFWETQGMDWRTEPEIGEDRQRFLAERRAVTPDIAQGVYPFKDITLTRADVEWLLATHDNGRGPPRWEEVRDKLFLATRWGLDLRGADVRGVSLTALPLVRTVAGLPDFETTGTPKQRRDQIEAAAAHFEGADLTGAHLERSGLFWAHLEGSTLAAAHLDGAGLWHAHLEGAVLSSATFSNASLADAHLEGASLDGTDLRGAFLGITGFQFGGHEGVVRPGAHLAGADLQAALLDVATGLQEVSFSDEPHGGAFLVDVGWGSASLGQANWTSLTELGEEQVARLPDARRRARKFLNPEVREFTRDEWRQRAVRAYRQLVPALRTQGLHEDADRFAYRAQVLQRRVLRRQGHWLRSLGSLFLDAVSGYGYRPMRSVLTYLLVVAGFAVAYFALGSATGHPLAWNEALVVSLTAFHGRGFFASVFQPSDPQAALAAMEAVIGLLIEIIFIATFTQRFFAR